MASKRKRAKSSDAYSDSDSDSDSNHSGGFRDISESGDSDAGLELSASEVAATTEPAAPTESAAATEPTSANNNDTTTSAEDTTEEQLMHSTVDKINSLCAENMSGVLLKSKDGWDYVPWDWTEAEVADYRNKKTLPTESASAGMTQAMDTLKCEIITGILKGSSIKVGDNIDVRLKLSPRRLSQAKVFIVRCSMDDEGELYDNWITMLSENISTLPVSTAQSCEMEGVESTREVESRKLTNIIVTGKLLPGEALAAQLFERFMTCTEDPRLRGGCELGEGDVCRMDYRGERLLDADLGLSGKAQNEVKTGVPDGSTFEQNSGPAPDDDAEPPKDPHQETDNTTGLVNYGTTCFVNAAVSLFIAHGPLLRRAASLEGFPDRGLAKAIARLIAVGGQGSGKSAEVNKALEDVKREINAMAKHEGRPLNRKTPLEAAIRWRLERQIHQDPSELISSFLGRKDIMGEVLNETMTFAHMTMLRCKDCGEERACEPAMEILLHLPIEKDVDNLLDLYYRRVSAREDVNLSDCGNSICTAMGPVAHESRVRLGANEAASGWFIVDLHRLGWNRTADSSERTEGIVVFPEGCFFLPGFQTLFYVAAALDHIGEDGHFGHFTTTFRRLDEDAGTLGKWERWDDNVKTRDVPFKDVNNRNNYLLLLAPYAKKGETQRLAEVNVEASIDEQLAVVRSKAVENGAGASESEGWLRMVSDFQLFDKTEGSSVKLVWDQSKLAYNVQKITDPASSGDEYEQGPESDSEWGSGEESSSEDESDDDPVNTGKRNRAQKGKAPESSAPAKSATSTRRNQKRGAANGGAARTAATGGEHADEIADESGNNENNHDANPANKRHSGRERPWPAQMWDKAIEVLSKVEDGRVKLAGHDDDYLKLIGDFEKCEPPVDPLPTSVDMIRILQDVQLDRTSVNRFDNTPSSEIEDLAKKLGVELTDIKSYSSLGILAPDDRGMLHQLAEIVIECAVSGYNSGKYSAMQRRAFQAFPDWTPLILLRQLTKLGRVWRQVLPNDGYVVLVHACARARTKLQRQQLSQRLTKDIRDGIEGRPPIDTIKCKQSTKLLVSGLSTAFGALEEWGRSAALLDVVDFPNWGAAAKASIRCQGIEEGYCDPDISLVFGTSKGQINPRELISTADELRKLGEGMVSRYHQLPSTSCATTSYKLFISMHRMYTTQGQGTVELKVDSDTFLGGSWLACRTEPWNTSRWMPVSYATFTGDRLDKWTGCKKSLEQLFEDAIADTTSGTSGKTPALQITHVFKHELGHTGNAGTRFRARVRIDENGKVRLVGAYHFTGSDGSYLFTANEMQDHCVKSVQLSCTNENYDDWLTPEAAGKKKKKRRWKCNARQIETPNSGEYKIACVHLKGDIEKDSGLLSLLRKCDVGKGFDAFNKRVMEIMDDGAEVLTLDEHRSIRKSLIETAPELKGQRQAKRQPQKKKNPQRKGRKMKS